MGMTIEKLVAENDRLNRQLAYEATALTMMKVDYENRLKADMVAMLEELKQDIIAESWGLSAFVEDSKDLVVDVSDIDKVFYERITALKGQE